MLNFNPPNYYTVFQQFLTLNTALWLFPILLFLRLNNAKKIRKLYFMSKNEYFVLKLLFFPFKVFGQFILIIFNQVLVNIRIMTILILRSCYLFLGFENRNFGVFINVILHPLVFLCMFIRLCLFLFLWLISALWLHIFSRLYLIILRVICEP